MRQSRSVVYFAFLGDEDADPAAMPARLGFMGEQLRWIAELIRPSAEPIEVVVAYVAPRAWDAEVHHAIASHGFSIDPASIESDRRNRFEYPGFRAMKAVAERSSPDHLIYYCHSKGISQLSPGKMGLFRLHTEVGLTADLALLTGNPAITRAGLFPSRRGWCWHNFFWIKAGYMARLPVEESDDRYHFEALIGDHGDRQGYEGVLPLIDRLPFADTGIAAQPWYRPEETTSATLVETCYRYAGLQSPVTRPSGPAHGGSTGSASR
ncbi:hypothetical protein [Rhizorhabdus dicambivorans]|uniref:Uncharacterized protein n=1 Tax=Rhizorhabdus dicambivorans TaxID=1850238 RepID=A0A2A4FSM3_9SPHN|nr:hypothetical protein [Rhizorhabdus dicambivorans]ATE64462.1 hypothetical protein CMV14_08665 [Rhizorhabdus dicambivorans]PCE41187.1 hypothetical protein COO09_16040 [Rhizorhabdus dicambivorans]